VTVGQIVATPEPMRDANDHERRERFEFASPDALAEEWRSFEEQGVGHLIVWPQPYDAGFLNLVTAAQRIYRDGSGE
jgi:hypothetical protein